MAASMLRGAAARWIAGLAVALLAAPAALLGFAAQASGATPSNPGSPMGAQVSGAASSSAAQSSAAAAAPPTPVRTVPPLSGASADSCAPLTIAWMQSSTVGPVHVDATYLDPTVVLSCIKANYPDAAAQKVQASRQLAGFPGTVRISLRLQAQDEGPLAPGNWHVTLGAGAARSAAVSHTVTETPDLVTQGTGTAYQETIVFAFRDAGGDLLPPKADLLTATVTGPSGSARLSWNFSGKALPSGAATGGAVDYIPILSWVVVGIGVALVVALWVTRPTIRQDAA